MSESIYNNDDPSSINTPAVENNEGIYMTLYPKRSQERTHTPKKEGQQSQPHAQAKCGYSEI